MAEETDTIQEPQVQQPPASAKLYQNLIKDGYTHDNLGSYDDFNKALQNPLTANKIYSGLRADGYTENNLGSLKEFQTSFSQSQKKNDINQSSNGLENSPNTKTQMPGWNTPVIKPTAKTAPQSFQMEGPARKKNSWANLGDFLPQTVMGGLDKDAGQALRFMGDNLWKGPTPLVNKDMGDKISHAGLKLEGWGQEHQDKAQQNKLPETITGNIVSTATGFVPTALELALTPEFDVAKIGKLGEVLTKYGGKYAPKIVNTLGGKFPALMGTTGLTSGYSDAKDNGASDYDALKTGLVKSAEEYGKGVLFDGAASGAAKASDIGKKVLEDNGWMADNKIVAGAQKKILHSTAQAIGFSAVPFISNAVQGNSTSMKELSNNAIFGGLMGLFHGEEPKSPETPSAADGAAKEVIQRSPLIDLHNFMNADMDAIKYTHALDETPVDLQIQAATHAEKAFKEDEPETKQQQVVQSSMNGKLASIKSVTQAILKDKDAVIGALPDDIDKQPIIDKINQVHKELDPVEQKKTVLGNQINAIDQQIKEASDSKPSDAITQAENEVKLENLTQQREELNNGLKDLIIKQNEQNKEVPAQQPADETADPAETTNPINEAGGDKTAPEFANENEAKRYAIEKETNPNKIAAQYHTEQAHEPDYIERGVMDYMRGSKINQRDFERWGDKNKLDDVKQWIDHKNSDGIGLDVHAAELSHELGVEVTPQDFIETIERYKGRKNFEDSQKSEIQKALKDKYADLTGKNLTPSMAERVYLSETKKLSTAEAKDFNAEAKKIGITEQDVDNYEQFRKNTEPGTDNGRNAEPTKDKVSKPANQQSGRPKESSGDKSTQSKSLSDDERSRLRELSKKFRGQLNDVTRIPTLLADKEFREYAGLVFKEAAGDFKAFSKELIEHVGEKIKEHLPGLFKELGGKLSDDEEKALEKQRDQEQVKTYGTKNAITEELQQGLGLPPIEIPKDRSDDESLAAWKTGKRTPMEITEQLLDPNTDIYDKSITANDEPIMREYIRQLGERTKDLNKIKLHLQDKVDAGDKDAEYDVASVGEQIDRHLDEFNNALNASKVGGNIWHKVGDERQKAIDDNGLILNSIERIKNIYGNDIPPEVKKQLDDLQKRNDELTAKIEKAVEDAKNNIAIQTVIAAVKRKSIFGTKKLSDAEFKGAVKDVLGDLKKDWKKSFTNTYTTVPGIPQFNAIAPHIAKLVRLYADRGISKLDDIITHIHDDVKDDLEGITKDNIRDLIAGKYSDKKPISELRKKVNELRVQARNQAKIEELERGIVAKTKAKGEASPEVKALQKQVLKLRKNAINDNPELSADQLKKEANIIQNKIDKGDHFKPPLVKRTWEKNPEWIKSNQEKGDLNMKLKKMERDAMDSQKSTYMRRLDKANRYGRRIIFWGANAVYTHLASSAVIGSLLHRGPEFIVGKGINKMFPRLAEGAPIEGYLNLKTEAKFWRRIINIAQTAKNTKSIFMTGETEMSKQRSQRPHEYYIPGVDFAAAGGHQAIKDPIVEATALASDEAQMNFYRAHGIDETHPLMLEASRQRSWNRAQYEIFQNPAKNANIIKAYFNQLEKKGINNAVSDNKVDRLKGNTQYTEKSIYDFMVPINTAPTNMVSRELLAMRLPDKLIKAWNENGQLKKGIDRLTAEDKDLLLLQLKKGTVNAFYWSLGAMVAGSAAGGLYTKFYSDKERREKSLDPESGFLQLGGMDVPKDWQHNSQFQALQNGATWWTIYNHYSNDRDESVAGSFAKAGFGTTEAISEQVPSVKSIWDLKEAGTTPYGEKKYIDNFKRRIGVKKVQDLGKLMGYGVDDE